MFLFVFYLSLLKAMKFWSHEIPTRKNFRPKKYPREKILDSRNIREKKYRTHKVPTRKNFGPTKARWHGCTEPMRLGVARDPRNLAHPR